MRACPSPRSSCSTSCLPTRRHSRAPGVGSWLGDTATQGARRLAALGRSRNRPSGPLAGLSRAMNSAVDQSSAEPSLSSLSSRLPRAFGAASSEGRSSDLPTRRVRIGVQRCKGWAATWRQAGGGVAVAAASCCGRFPMKVLLAISCTLTVYGIRVIGAVKLMLCPGATRERPVLISRLYSVMCRKTGECGPCRVLVGTEPAVAVYYPRRCCTLHRSSVVGRDEPRRLSLPIVYLVVVALARVATSPGRSYCFLALTTKD